MDVKSTLIGRHDGATIYFTTEAKCNMSLVDMLKSSMESMRSKCFAAFAAMRRLKNFY
jgi:hypothetical protein